MDNRYIDKAKEKLKQDPSRWYDQNIVAEVANNDVSLFVACDNTTDFQTIWQVMLLTINELERDNK